MDIACLGSAAGMHTRKCGYWNGKIEMDCAAREGIQFSDSNGYVEYRLPGFEEATILVVDDEVASAKCYRCDSSLPDSVFVCLFGEQALGILAGSHVDAVLPI